MKVKVVLFTGYGGHAYTPTMLKIMKKYKGMKTRTNEELIKYIEIHSVVYENDQECAAFDIGKNMENNPEMIVTFKNKQNIYYIYDQNYHYLKKFSIIEVDTSRPWTIKEHDGSESIKYLDKMVCVDKELNYWEEKYD